MRCADRSLAELDALGSFFSTLDQPSRSSPPPATVPAGSG